MECNSTVDINSQYRSEIHLTEQKIIDSKDRKCIDKVVHNLFSKDNFQSNNDITNERLNAGNRTKTINQSVLVGNEKKQTKCTKNVFHVKQAEKKLRRDKDIKHHSRHKYSEHDYSDRMKISEAICSRVAIGKRDEDVLMNERDVVVTKNLNNETKYHSGVVKQNNKNRLEIYHFDKSISNRMNVQNYSEHRSNYKFKKFYFNESNNFESNHIISTSHHCPTIEIKNKSNEIDSKDVHSRIKIISGEKNRDLISISTRLVLQILLLISFSIRLNANEIHLNNFENRTLSNNNPIGSMDFLYESKTNQINIGTVRPSIYYSGDHLNDTLTTDYLINTTTDSSIYLNYYLNYPTYPPNRLNIETSASANETKAINSTFNEKWWLNFFPEKYVDEKLEFSEFLFRVFGVCVCTVLIFTTLFGNILTITVVLRFNRMKTVTNILLASLAVADITVALLVMPFLIISDYLRVWPFGAAICHFYISCDVMCCTASIQHLCAVAIDRYWAINKPLHYHRLVNKRRLVFSIILIWLMSVFISFIPVFSGIYHEREITVSEIFLMTDYPNCYLQVNILYAIFSSTISFYLPLPIMFYVYIRILLIAERQNREIKQLESHLRFNGAHYRNSAPVVTSNLDTRSSTTNITANSLPSDHLTRQLTVQQPPINQDHVLSQYQSLETEFQNLFLHGMPNCVISCHCNNVIPNQKEETKIDIKDSARNDQNNKDANNNTKISDDITLNTKNSIRKVEKPDLKNEQDSADEKTKLLNTKTENSFQRKSKYTVKKFDTTVLTNLESKENDATIDKLNIESTIRPEKSPSITQSISTPLVLDLIDDSSPAIKKQRANSNPKFEQVKSTDSLKENEKDTHNEMKELNNLNKKESDQLNQNNAIDRPAHAIVPQQALHHHCCCFNQHLIYCAHQLHTRILQQQQQQNVQAAKIHHSQKQPSASNIANPLTFAQNLLHVLATHFPPLGDNFDLKDGYSSASTSTLNNLSNQPVHSAVDDNQLHLHAQQNLLCVTPQLTGINMQFQTDNQQSNFPNQTNNTSDNQLAALHHFNEFLQQTQQQHQNCCSGNLINWTSRKCSDTSTVSGPIASCSSTATKSISSTAANCHFLHFPNHTSPMYNSTGSSEEKQAIPNQMVSVQFDMNSSNGMHQARSENSVAVMNEIKRAQRQLRKRSKQILTDTKAIRTLGIVMGIFCACWFPFFIFYILLAFWPDLPISYEWKSAVTWLGYLNSSLNPCIYALLNKEFKIAFKRVLNCHPRIMVHNASGNFSANQAAQRQMNRDGFNHSYTQNFGMGNANQVVGKHKETNGRKRGFLSAVGIIREFSSSGTFTKDLMEYIFGNGTTTCLLNSEAASQQQNTFMNRNQGIRISFDFSGVNDMPISNCSTRQPSIASSYEAPIVSTLDSSMRDSKDNKSDNNSIDNINISRINKELLTVQTRQTGRSISSEDLNYANATELHSSGVSSGCNSTLSAPEQGRTIVKVTNSHSRKSKEQKSFVEKFGIAKNKKCKVKRDENDAKDHIFLSVKDTVKSNSMLNILRRKSIKRKHKNDHSDDSNH